MSIPLSVKENHALCATIACCRKNIDLDGVKKDAYYDFGSSLKVHAHFVFRPEATIHKSHVQIVENADGEMSFGQDLFASDAKANSVNACYLKKGDIKIVERATNPPLVVRARDFKKAFYIRHSKYVMRPRPVVMLNDLDPATKKRLKLNTLTSTREEPLCLLRHAAHDHLWEVIKVSELRQYGTVKRGPSASKSSKTSKRIFQRIQRRKAARTRATEMASARMGGAARQMATAAG